MEDVCEDVCSRSTACAPATPWSSLSDNCLHSSARFFFVVSHGWASPTEEAAMRELRLFGEPVALVRAKRVLGAHLEFGHAHHDGVHLDRMRAASERSRKIGYAPGSGALKREMVQVASHPMALHGGEVASIPASLMNSYS